MGDLALKFDECFESWNILEHLSAISANVSNFGTLRRPARLMLESVTSQSNTFSQNRTAAKAAANAAVNASERIRER